MHETSAQGWCTGKTQRDRVEREVGGGIGMGNICISKAEKKRKKITINIKKFFYCVIKDILKVAYPSFSF